MLRLVFELQPLFDAAGMKEFTDDLLLSEYAKHKSMHGKLVVL